MSAQSAWQPWLEDRSSAALHERLAGAVESDILNGTLAPGARLPAHRDLARRLGVSVGTATRAYMNLEHRGLIRGEHGRGTFVAAQEGERETIELVDLSVNIPPPMLAARKLASALAALPQSRTVIDFSTYSDPAGLPRHRQAIASWLQTQGMPVEPERVMITHGAQHALAMAFAAEVAPEGVVVTEAHTYPGALEPARQARQQIISVDVDDRGMVPEMLAGALSSTRGAATRIVYLTPTLHNPYGFVMDQRRRAEIVAVCQKYDATIIEDDVYSVFRDKQTTPLAMLAPERTWYINGFSKSLSPGLRIGILIAPEKNRNQARVTLQSMSLGVSPLMGELVARWITDGTVADISTALRAESEERLSLAVSMLAPHIPAVPSGGFHLWLPMANNQADRTVHSAAREGVLLTPPGSMLSDPMAKKSGVRVCVGRPDHRQLERGLARLRRVIETS